jgi:hypothetical protein
VKYLDETTIDKYKARVCGCGNKLVQSATYTNETYSPTVAHLTHSTLPKAVAEVCNPNPKTTYRVKKYIYGLPDSGRAYYIAYRDHLVNSGYVMTSADPCLFVRLTKDIRTFVWIQLAV